MCLADLIETREVITAAATAEVPRDRPAIYGAVTLHCLEAGESLRLSMPMSDALLLLNSLRQIEADFDLQDWSARLSSATMTSEELGAAMDDLELENDLAAPMPRHLNS